MNRLLAFFLSCALMVGAVTVADAARPSGKRVINGTDVNNVLRGSRAADIINGGRGNDYLLGGSGNDVLTGGPGRDTISGGNGNDRINARDGEADRILCGKGRDIVYRDKKIDRVSGDCETQR